MKIFPILFLIVFIYKCPLNAQHYEVPKYQLSISYFGEMLTHGGIRLGLTTPISQRIKEKNDSRFVNKGWIIGGYMTYYKHPRNHRGLMFTSSIGRQRISKSGFQTNINFEAGYMLSLLDGEVYEWDGGQIVTGNKGSSHIVLGFNGGAGWNFEKNGNLPIALMIQPHFYIQAPYNTLFAPRVALEAKLAYNIK